MKRLRIIGFIGLNLIPLALWLIAFRGGVIISLLMFFVILEAAYANAMYAKTTLRTVLYSLLLLMSVFFGEYFSSYLNVKHTGSSYDLTDYRNELLFFLIYTALLCCISVFISYLRHKKSKDDNPHNDNPV